MKSYLAVLIYLITIISGYILLLAGILNPWLLVLSEFLNSINIKVPACAIQWVARNASDYFEHEIIYSSEIDMKKQYIKCLMPHGVFPFTSLFLHKKDDVLVTSRLLYKAPFLSHSLKTLNGIPALYDDMNRALQAKKSLLVYPGGVREIFKSSQECIVIKKRKGIFRLALENGVPLLPIYTFGLSQIYKRSDISITFPYLFKNKKDTAAYYYGYYYTPFPFQKKLFSVVGKPIPVKKKKDVTLQDINSLRDIYIQEVKKLYYTYETSKLKIR
jgi:2-acylglycerol O-acyltransferase 2